MQHNISKRAIPAIIMQFQIDTYKREGSWTVVATTQRAERQDRVREILSSIWSRAASTDGLDETSFRSVVQSYRCTLEDHIFQVCRKRFREVLLLLEISDTALKVDNETIGASVCEDIWHNEAYLNTGSTICSCVSVSVCACGCLCHYCLGSRSLLRA